MALTRTDIINRLIRFRGGRTYLEIGYQFGKNFRLVMAEEKVSVDPDPKAEAMYVMTSDEFFAQNTMQFDCVFVDGDHSCEQVKRDIENSLKCLSPSGFIVVHDCLPVNELMQRVPRVSKAWTGDVWRAFMHLRTRPDLQMSVIDVDCGCGIIMKGMQHPVIVKEEDLHWRNFTVHKREWMNILTEEEFDMIVPDFPRPATIPEKHDLMPGRIFFNIVFDPGGNLGVHYNKVMETLGDEDACCFIDADAMFTTYNYGKQLYDVLKKYPKCGLFVATANRIGCTWQRNGDWGSDDIVAHRKFGQQQLEQHYDAIDDVTTKYGNHVMGGFLILIRKKTWKRLGGFKEVGQLGVDNDLHRRAKAKGEKVYLMKGVYLYHWYRGGDRNNKSNIVMP